MEKKEYTKYEKVRIISARALQLEHGAPPLIKVPKDISDPIEIAKLEWEQGVIPIDVKENKSKENKENQ